MLFPYLVVLQKQGLAMMSKFFSLLTPLYSIFFFMAIFELIISLLLVCSILTYVKRIAIYNARYAIYAKFCGLMLLIGNMMAGSMNLYFGLSGTERFEEMKENGHLIWVLIFFPYYCMTEFLPAVAFAVTMKM